MNQAITKAIRNPLSFNIAPVSPSLDPAIQRELDSKTKPAGALGELEKIAFRIARIRGSVAPKITSPVAIVFAADHGITRNHAVSAYPREVTAQMVENILRGGAACSVLAAHQQIPLKVVDSGVDAELCAHPNLISRSMGKGSKDMLEAPAMTPEQVQHALQSGADCIDELRNEMEIDIFLPGEMGIGNTSSAALLTHKLCALPLERLVGSGTGLSTRANAEKRETLQRVAELHDYDSGLCLVAAVGGFEIVMMAGAMLRSASLKIPVVIDGFICTAALLVARAISPDIGDYAIFAHRSAETGHLAQLEHLKVRPLLSLDMRLGEASGALVALPLIRSAVELLTDMARFDEAKIAGPTAAGPTDET